jgi:RNA polymerase sigma-70 factor (ECF subfamily)
VANENTQTKYDFDNLVKEYRERLYWLIRKIVIVHNDADDVLQNTFIKIWKGLPGFKGESGIYTWLYRIAVNESVTFLNKKRKEAHPDFEDYENYLSNSLQSDTFFDGDELQLKLQQAILTLPEKQRIVFNLRYFEETNYRDMSEILGTSEGALKASYHHAVKKIEGFFEED